MIPSWLEWTCRAGHTFDPCRNEAIGFLIFGIFLIIIVWCIKGENK